MFYQFKAFFVTLTEAQSASYVGTWYAVAMVTCDVMKTSVGTWQKIYWPWRSMAVLCQRFLSFLDTVNVQDIKEDWYKNETHLSTRPNKKKYY